MSARSDKPHASRLRRTARRAARSESTNVACSAPRDKASTPSAPLPANRSSTRAPSTAPRLHRALKIASRTRSDVGRVRPPGGATSVRPLALPPRTRRRGRYRPVTSVGRRPTPPRGGGWGSGRSGILVAMSHAAGERVRVIRIDQPRVRNAINSKTAQRLHDQFVAFDYDESARVAVLTGDTEAFCAGANLRDLPRLRRIVGLGRALDLILTGREIDAEEAERIGLVDRLVPAGTALEDAIALAEQIASFPWRCVVNDRRAVYDGLGLGIADALANEDRRGRDHLLTEPAEWGWQPGDLLVYRCEDCLDRWDVIVPGDSADD